MDAHEEQPELSTTKPKRARKPKPEVADAPQAAKPKTAKKGALPELLRIELDAPGMNPSFRAGAGGLAAALYFIAREQGRPVPWVEPVPLGPGHATVGARHIEIHFGGDPKATLTELFRLSFRLSPDGLIELAGTFEPSSPPDLWLAAQLQSAITSSILQHNKHRTLDENTQYRVQSIDSGAEATFSFRKCHGYEHQQGAGIVLKALSKPVELAGWAYIGASERHSGLSGTKWVFAADSALSAVFTVIGGLTLVAGHRGVLLLPEPFDLRHYARHRPRMTPRVPSDVRVASAGDAALRLRLQLRMNEELSQDTSVEGIHAVVMATLPWDKKGTMSRRDALELGAVSKDVLDTYGSLIHLLPTRVRLTKKYNDETGKPEVFTATSPLRAFVADNLSRGRRWFSGFATATNGVPSDLKPLMTTIYQPEKEAIMALTEHLEDAELALVRAVHIAIRQRFGAIGDEIKNNGNAAVGNRFAKERDRWRLAFAGAKTHVQIRAVLADLWSRAGSNHELKEHWQTVLPLLREQHWQTARDLALIALASYRGKETETEIETDDPASPEFVD